jgi:hypothetical protein
MARHRWDARLAALAATKVGLSDSPLLHEKCEAGCALLFPRQILFSKQVAAPHGTPHVTQSAETVRKL